MSCRVVTTLASYFRGPGFKSRTGDWLPLQAFHGFLSLSVHM